MNTQVLADIQWPPDTIAQGSAATSFCCSDDRLSTVILRSLAPGTRYLVDDKVTGALDAIGQAEIWTRVLALAAARSIGILVISHEEVLLGSISRSRFRMGNR